MALVRFFKFSVGGWGHPLFEICTLWFPSGFCASSLCGWAAFSCFDIYFLGSPCALHCVTRPSLSPSLSPLSRVLCSRWWSGCVFGSTLSVSGTLRSEPVCVFVYVIASPSSW